MSWLSAWVAINNYLKADPSAAPRDDKKAAPRDDKKAALGMTKKLRLGMTKRLRLGMTKRLRLGMTNDGRYFTSASILASRNSSHLPSRFCRIDNVFPARNTSVPSRGFMTTESLVHR